MQRTSASTLANGPGGFSSTIEEHLTCPISREVFVDPVSTPQGHTFEKASIQSWLQNHATCPNTREPLSLSDLRPNLAVKQLCEAHRERQAIRAQKAAQRAADTTTLRDAFSLTKRTGAAIKIQAAMRGYLGRQVAIKIIADRELMRQNTAAITIQKYVRRHQVSSLIQKMLRPKIARATLANDIPSLQHLLGLMARFNLPVAGSFMPGEPSFPTMQNGFTGAFEHLGFHDGSAEESIMHLTDQHLRVFKDKLNWNGSVDVSIKYGDSYQLADLSKNSLELKPADFGYTGDGVARGICHISYIASSCFNVMFSGLGIGSSHRTNSGITRSFHKFSSNYDYSEMKSSAGLMVVCDRRNSNICYAITNNKFLKYENFHPSIEFFAGKANSVLSIETLLRTDNSLFGYQLQHKQSANRNLVRHLSQATAFAWMPSDTQVSTLSTEGVIQSFSADLTAPLGGLLSVPLPAGHRPLERTDAYPLPVQPSRLLVRDDSGLTLMDLQANRPIARLSYNNMWADCLPNEHVLFNPRTIANGGDIIAGVSNAKRLWAWSPTRQQVWTLYHNVDTLAMAGNGKKMAIIQSPTPEAERSIKLLGGVPKFAIWL